MHRYRKPLSVEVAEELQKKIAEGIYKPGDQLPSEVDFARELGVSRATLREAFSILHRQGFITRKHGVGSFVAEPEKQILSSFEKLESMVGLIRRSGYEPAMHVLENDFVALDDECCELMELPRGTAGYRFATLYSANGIPFVYTNEFTARSIVPDQPAYDRSQCEDLADFLTKNTSNPPTATLTRLKGILPTKQLMEILMIDAATPIIRQRFTLFDKHEQVVGCGYDYFNSSWFEFSIYTDTIRL
ncbi:MAG: GntR family transcriptional regulator [Spirochaetota bacterium]